ncbi:MAG: host attachment protein [Verrucomicrobiota bacterium]
MNTPTIKNTYDRLLILTDLGRIRVLAFKHAGDPPQDLSHLIELSENELSPPRGAVTTDIPGKFNRGFAAGNGNSKGEAMSHAETKLNMEVEKRSISQVAGEICEVVRNLGCHGFVLAAPEEYLKRLEAQIEPDCREKLLESHGTDLTKADLKELEKRFL